MNRIVFVLLLMSAGHGLCMAQASGNIGYSQSGGNARAEQNERNKRVLAKEDAPPSATGMFIEASVLMNVKADEHVAVFGLAQECVTVAECNQKLDATVSRFSGDLKRLGIASGDIFVDFAAQNKIYGFQLEGNLAKERLTGFELKKNISVRYQDKLLLDKLLVAAARSEIFDLIKVDYVVRDTSSIHNRLAEEAARLIKQKMARHEKLLGIKLQPPAQVFAERYSAYFPTEMYDSYTAYEAEDVSRRSYNEDRYIVQRARKSR
ncbi:MAG TPA: SIMPL domain-containing protein, partial [Pyrinomonadaceae bacterium]